jgi:uncharacterized iron-regulated membrane protein
VSFQIEEPKPLRTVGVGVTAGGALLTVFAGFTGAAALVGVIMLCCGISLLDAVDLGWVGRRQLGLFLLALGAVVGAWALIVVVLLAILGLAADTIALALLGGSFLAAGGGTFILRYASSERQAVRASASQRVSATPRRQTLTTGARRAGRVAG